MILLYIIYGINYEVVHEVHKDESKYSIEQEIL